MSLISSLPYDIIFHLEDYLSNSDLQTLLSVFIDFHDKSILLATYVKLSEKTIVISDTPGNELISETDHVYLDLTNSIQFFEGIILFDESYGTNIVPKRIVLDFNLSNDTMFVEFHRQIVDLLKNVKQSRRFSTSTFDLILRDTGTLSTKEILSFLRGLSLGIGPQTTGITFRDSIASIDLRYVTTLFNSIKCIDLNGFRKITRIDYLPQSVGKVVFKDVQLDGKTLSNQTKSLRLKNSVFDHSHNICLPDIKELALCNVLDISSFVRNNLSRTLVSLELDNVELEFDNLSFHDLHNLEHLKLIDLSSELGYEFQCPPLLHLLYIQDKYLPYISIDFPLLPETLTCLTLKGGLPFKFDNKQFPRNLNSLVLQGGGGIFQCENFKCPPNLQSLIITLQKFRNVHKFKLVKTLREVNLSSNNIKKISTIKFPSNIVTLCLSNNNFLNIKGVKFPYRMEQIDLTQKYSLIGAYDFTQYNWLSKANIFASDCNKFVFNNKVEIINDYDWRVDKQWKNREIEFFY
ncbi:uncharacterized protein AC631_00094 [Debaryomyces fabryi]|uniref:F-box domain-containing protein n=1 Tax=Debaryomyces fabryi TaxID=58627 RepID=A0A0V1Q7Q0_9ASCO|nr:uncharacterized protein AC631_00094 [Debaryomyces fabryi]KSA04223.1 hypothetical protein AC631_00094 [Debaryomyces fabryi]CUM46282.1 unnamed protein product [Debaryomyces fabryi]